jgi:hypothetical protein
MTDLRDKVFMLIFVFKYNRPVAYIFSAGGLTFYNPFSFFVHKGFL